MLFAVHPKSSDKWISLMTYAASKLSAHVRTVADAHGHFRRYLPQDIQKGLGRWMRGTRDNYQVSGETESRSIPVSSERHNEADGRVVEEKIASDVA
jgi:hypothetical protein